MCLVYNKEATEKLKKQFGNKETLTCYKIFTQGDNMLWSPIIGGHFMKEPGVFISNRKSKKLHVKSGKNEINKGIHVFTNKKVAQNWVNYFYKGHFVSEKTIVKVEVNKRDLVAAGFYSDGCNPVFSNQAVFMKVNISAEEWNRIFS